jgi:hypothetical protein
MITGKRFSVCRHMVGPLHRMSTTQIQIFAIPMSTLEVGIPSVKMTALARWRRGLPLTFSWWTAADAHS